MTHQDSKRSHCARELFHRVAEHPQAERASVLAALLAAEHEGDAELRREVESLLAMDNSATATHVHPRRPMIDAGSFTSDQRSGENPGDDDPPVLSSGYELANYRIESLLGRGGMGEVYVATDLRLKRRIALKLMPDWIGARPGSLARFRREAESLAALNHPHIVTIYSFEEAAGHHFLTMELIPGQSLETEIPAGGLERASFFELARSLAQAVSAAHARGIVHRDLKPSNLMRTQDGRLKVLDFGLAKFQQSDTAERPDRTAGTALTTEGNLLGTVPYMSPEQAQGRTVDARSDIFSMGSVLFELATGQRAFAGTETLSLLNKIVHSEVEDLEGLRPDLAQIRPVLDACLVKDPDQRTITASDVAEMFAAAESASAGGTSLHSSATIQLQSPPSERSSAAGTTQSRSQSRSQSESPSRPPVTSSRQPTVAVLPFETTESDPESSALASGLSGDIIDGLTSTTFAIVSSAGSGRDLDERRVHVGRHASETGVAYLLSGEVRKAGDRLRIAIRLVETETGQQVWSRRYQGDLAKQDLFDFQEEVQAQVVSAIGDVHGAIFGLERQRAKGLPIDQLAPWQCIYVALGYDKFIDEKHHTIARNALEHAVEIEPQFALAWAYLSWIYTDEFVYGFNVLADSMERASIAARRAVEIAPGEHMHRWLLSRMHFFRGELERFLAESRKALELNSKDATVVGLVGMYTCLAGDWQRGTGLVRQAMSQNPLYPPYYHWPLALDFYRRGDYEAALAEHYNFAATGNFLFESLSIPTLAHLGRLEEASAEWQRLSPLLPEATEASVREPYERFNIRSELWGSILDGMRKAGLESAE